MRAGGPSAQAEPPEAERIGGHGEIIQMTSRYLKTNMKPTAAVPPLVQNKRAQRPAFPNQYVPRLFVGPMAIFLVMLFKKVSV